MAGCSAAAFLAEAGARVAVVDPRGVAGGASGRNSGVLQHPLDPDLEDLHVESLRLHREVVALRDDPDGILLLGATSTAGLPAAVRPERVEEASAVEPLVRPGIPAVRLHTGWAVGPTAVTQAWWRRAEAAGATLRAGDPPPAGAVLHATGAWTPGVVAQWGVTARARTRFPATHVLEEAGVEGLRSGEDREVFSLVGDVLGSTFSAAEPDPQAARRRLRERARRFVGAVDLTSARACPRPRSPDGLPLVGRTGPDAWVCAGHGPWGISIGPATARLAADAILAGDDALVPRHLTAARFAAGGAGAGAAP